MEKAQIVVCIATGLIVWSNPWVIAADSAASPYQGIVERNAFGLRPEPTRIEDPPPLEPPAKITVTGIVSIQEPARVLYKVSRAKAGQPTTEALYVLSEGQEQDGILVMKIDAKALRVTFANGSTVQQIELANSPPSQR